MSELQLTKYLTDPSWIAVWVALITLLAGIAIPIWIWVRQTDQRELAFGIATSTRLVDVNQALTGRVTVQLDGRTVENVHSLILVLRNSGNRPIRPADFHTPLSVTFDSGEILSSEVIFTLPEEVEGVVSQSNRTLTLEPSLLNPGDQIAIHVLFSGNDVDLSTNYRIEGVSSIADLEFSQPLPPFWKSGGPMTFLVVVLGFLGQYFWDGAKDSRMLVYGAFMLVLFMGMAAFHNLWYNRSANRRVVAKGESRAHKHRTAHRQS